MIPSLTIRVETGLVFFVGFALDWWWLTRRDTERPAQLFAS